MSSHVARAMALAAVRLGVARGALDRLGGRDGAATRALVDAARVDVGALHDACAAARPAGWREIDPSWLAGPAEPPAGSPPPVARYLDRIAYGALVPMHGGGRVHPLVALRPRAMLRVLTALGRRQLAHALGDSSPRSVADLAARLPFGRDLLADVASVHALGATAEPRLGPRAAARARISGLGWSDPLALVRAGTRAIAGHVDTIPDLAAQVAQRLPRPVGAVVLAELRAAAATAGAGATELGAVITRVTAATR